jgi:hypothetical protein
MDFGSSTVAEGMEVGKQGFWVRPFCLTFEGIASSGPVDHQGWSCALVPMVDMSHLLWVIKECLYILIFGVTKWTHLQHCRNPSRETQNKIKTWHQTIHPIFPMSFMVDTIDTICQLTYDYKKRLLDWFVVFYVCIHPFDGSFQLGLQHFHNWWILCSALDPFIDLGWLT